MPLGLLLDESDLQRDVVARARHAAHVAARAGTAPAARGCRPCAARPGYCCLLLGSWSLLIVLKSPTSVHQAGLRWRRRAAAPRPSRAAPSSSRAPATARSASAAGFCGCTRVDCLGRLAQLAGWRRGVTIWRGRRRPTAHSDQVRRGGDDGVHGRHCSRTRVTCHILCRVKRAVAVHGVAGGLLIAALRVVEIPVPGGRPLDRDLRGPRWRVLFAGAGIWLGLTLTRRESSSASAGPVPGPLRRSAGIASARLGITPRELEILPADCPRHAGTRNRFDTFRQRKHGEDPHTLRACSTSSGSTGGSRRSRRAARSDSSPERMIPHVRGENHPKG